MEKSKFYQIKNITEYEYTLVGCDGSVITRPIRDVDKSASAFTIQDAKDGDILVAGKDKRPFIFRGLLDKSHPDNPVAYCGIDSGNELFISTNINWWTDEKVEPATKEQRDQLKKVMTDAGWEFDFDNKELKKIEQIPTWSEKEDDEKHYDRILKELRGQKQIPVNAPYIELIDSDIDWLKSLKDRVQPQPKQEWSEEDGEMIDNIIDYMKPMPVFFKSTKGKSGKEYTKAFIKEATKWLKSLKDRYNWKPSDEQMDALETATSSLQSTALESLYNELKKL